MGKQAQETKQTLMHIGNMTCVNCANKIEDALQHTKGIVTAAVSYNKGMAQIEYDPNLIKLPQIAAVVEELDYTVLADAPQKGGKGSITKALGIVIILLALFVLMQYFGVGTLLNAFPVAQQGMGYGMLLIIGVITSVHCVGMCGGINLSQCIPQAAKAEEAGRFASVRPSALYNAGRVLSYTVIGAAVGGIGSVISLSGTAKGIVQLAAGVFMVIMGLNMLDVFPFLRKLNLRMPKIFAQKINSEKQSSSPFYVGRLNGLMPCGPLQAMQLYALSTGDPVKGALAMLVFSLGTVPLMFGLGALGGLLSKKFTRTIMTAGAALVIVLGVSMFSNGLALSGVGIPLLANTNGTTAYIAADGVQEVTTQLEPGTYQPITVKAGVPVRWTIHAEKGSLNGCNNSIIVPQYGLQQSLALGDTVIEFTPDKSGTFSYTCWMGMIRSFITVANPDGTVDQTAESVSAPATAWVPACCR